MGDIITHKERKTVLIHAAAYHFAHFSRKATEIAAALDVADKTIRRYADEPEWEFALKCFGYTGKRYFEREPRRNTARENGAVYDRAKEVYITLIRDGVPKHKINRLTGETVFPEMDPVKARNTIHLWAKRENWREESIYKVAIY